MKRIVLLITLAAMLPQGLSAQKSYPGGIEFGIGPSAGLNSVEGENGSALCGSSGVNYFLRYTHYLNGGFGLFAEVRDVLVNAYDYQYFGAMNKADGGKYRYRFNSGSYDLEYAPLVTLGGAYRMEYEKFNLVFRAGLGYGERSNDFSYERQSRDGSKGPEYVSVSVVGKDETTDYLIDDGYTRYYYASALVFSGSAQFVWKMRGRMYLFGEAGFDCSPSRYGVSVTTTGSKTDYNPINWVEAVSYADRKDVWTIDNSSKTVTTSTLGLGTHLNLTFGVGINLWKAYR